MRSILKFLLGLILLVGLFIALAYITGNEHLVRGVRYTYLIGRSSPEIDDLNFFPFATITAADPQPWPKGSRFGELQLKETDERKLTDLYSVGFLVIQHDSLILEKYWSGWDEDSVLNSFSVAKSYISLLTGIALKEGVIKNLDRKAGEFLPEFAEGCRSKITLEHLLTMSSGMDWSESGADPFSDNAKGYYGRNVRELSFDQPCRTDPGIEFDYTSGTTQIMAEVLEAAYGKDLDQLVHEKIWSKLGAETTAYWGKDRADGDLKAFCCLYATSRDLARIGQLYLDSGKWKGEEIIPIDFWKRSITPADLLDNGKPNDRYGFFWWLAQIDGMPIHYARGIHGQYVIVIPHEDLVIVRTGMKREEVNRQGHPSDVLEWIRIGRELATTRAGGPHIAAGRP